jgi:hypothetical protein
MPILLGPTEGDNTSPWDWQNSQFNLKKGAKPAQKLIDFVFNVLNDGSSTDKQQYTVCSTIIKTL